MQILPEHLNRARLRRLGELVSNVAFHRRRHEARVAVRNRAVHGLCGVLVFRFDQAAAEGRENLLARRLDVDPQNLFFLAAVHCEHAVAGRLHQGLAEVIISLVDCFSLSFSASFCFSALPFCSRRAAQS